MGWEEGREERHDDEEAVGLGGRKGRKGMRRRRRRHTDKMKE